MKKLIILLVLTGCGTDDSKESASVSSGIAVPAFGKTINMDDQLFQAKCNSAYFTYVTDGKLCGAGTIAETRPSTSLVYWTVKFAAENSIVFEGYNKSSTLQIQGVDYFCYQNQTSKYFYDKNGGKVYGQLMIISKKAASKPSDIQSGDIAYIGSDNAGLCNSGR